MALEEVKVGVYAAGEDLQGWIRILKQEGLPHEVTSDPVYPLTVMGSTLPAWLEDYVSGGGIAVISGAPDAPGVLPEGTLATIHHFLPPGSDKVCYSPAQVRLFQGEGEGECRLHEDRKVRHGNYLGLFPVVLTHPIGAGHIIYSGIPLTRLLSAAGDCLRRFSPYTEVTERVASVDKADLADTLVWMLVRAFQLGGLPYVRLARYPNGARSVFIFRIDVDGAFGGRTRRIAEVAAAHEVRASFYINGVRCEEDQGDLNIAEWPGKHEIGQHAYVHDMFEDLESNLHNLEKGAAWVEKNLKIHPHSFVAPRGLWNRSLDLAIARMGYPYSSDFSLDFDSLPFRTPGGVLQIPVNPFSPERAHAYADEHGLPYPTPDVVSSYYNSVLRWQMSKGRPVHLYGHPEHLGAMAEPALSPLFKLAREEGLASVTLAEFCDWWVKRESVGMSLHISRDTREVTVSFAGAGGFPVETVGVARGYRMKVDSASFSAVAAGSLL